MEVEVELRSNSHSDVVVDTLETSEIVADEPEVEQVLRRSSRTIRVPDRYSSSLHYLLLVDEREPESLDDALQLGDTTKWEQMI